MNAKRKFESSSVRRYVLLLIAVILVLSGSTLALLLWQQSTYDELADQANNYHLLSARLSALLEENLAIVEERALEQTLSLYSPPGASVQQRFPRATIATMLLQSAERLQAILEIQNRYRDPAFERTAQRLEQQFTALQTTASTLDLNTPNFLRNDLPTFIALKSRIDPLLLTLEQLQRLHSAAHRETNEGLARRHSAGRINFLLFVAFLFLIGAAAARKIYRMINRAIAEQLKTEEQLHFTRVAIEHISTAAYWMSPEGRFVHVNDAACRGLGYTREELLAMSTYDINPDIDADRWTDTWRRIEEEKSFTQETHHRRKDGSVFPVQITTNYLKFEGRKYNCSLVQDITERKRAEEALQTSEALLKEAQRVSNMGSWEWDIATGELKWSDEIYRLFGQTPQSFGATYEAFLGFIHPEDRQLVSDAVDAAINDREPYSLDHRILRPNGSVRYVHEQGEVTYGSDGTPLRILGTVHDVTDRKLTEDALVEKAEELARSNADLEQFAYVASHDLQEPLRMVTSFTQLLQRRYKGKLDDKADQYIGFAVEGTQRMQALIKDLMTYSRAGRPDRDFEPAECEDILQNSTANLKLAIQESGAVITHDPLPVVRGDEVQLGQVFQNLISNGLKFRREEAPRVHISAQLDGKQWIFSVHDNGLGIDPEFRERIFVIFQRLHHREDYEGTGIGLALCKKIVERHGGRIWVESEPGQGSTFYFTIPTEGVRHDERIQQPVG